MPFKIRTWSPRFNILNNMASPFPILQFMLDLELTSLNVRLSAPNFAQRRGTVSWASAHNRWLQIKSRSQIPEIALVSRRGKLTSKCAYDSWPAQIGNRSGQYITLESSGHDSLLQRSIKICPLDYTEPDKMAYLSSPCYDFWRPVILNIWKLV